MPVAIPLAVVGLSAAASGLAAVGAISALTASLIGIGVSIAGTLAQVLLTPHPKIPKPEYADGKQSVRQEIPGRVHSIGKDRRGGSLFFYETNSGGETLYIGTIHCAHRIDAVETYWLADQAVVIDEDGYVLNSPYQDVGGLEEENRVQIELHLGESDQAASTMLLDAFPEMWTADHRLRGLTYTSVSYADSDPEHHQEIYPNGPPPLTIEFRAALLFDPRDEDQIFDNELTHLWSDNAALGILYFMTKLEGEANVPVGFGLPLSRINLDSFITAADVCDEDVPLKAGGTEKRWRMWGSFNLALEEKKVILADMLECCDGRLVQGPDGKIGLIVGTDDFEVTISIPNNAVLRHEFPPPTNSLNRINVIKPKYRSGEHKFNEIEAGPQIDQASVDKFGERADSPSLRFVPANSQAQRVGRSKLRRLNPKWKGNIETNLIGLNAWGRRWIRLTITELGIDNEIFEVESMGLNRNTMTVTMDVASYDDWYTWNAATDEQDPPPVIVEEEPEGKPPTPTDVTVVIEQREVSLGNFVPVGVISWDNAPNSTGRYTVQARWRETGGTDRVINAARAAANVETPGLKDGVQYETEVRYLGQRGVPSLYSDTVLFTAVADLVAPGVPTEMSATLVADVDQKVQLSARAPNDIHFRALTFYRDTVNTFATESPVTGPLYGTPNQVLTFLDNPPAGVWWYRAKAENPSGITGPATAGVTVTTSS